MKRIVRGLNVPIAGEPAQDILAGPVISRVGIVADDYIGMMPTMLVQPGDRVQLGQPVFVDKKTEGVIYTSPAAGVVAEVNRGAKRKFESIVIDVQGDGEVTFASHDNLQSLTGEQVRKQLVESGHWVALRTRPFNRVPALD